MQKSCRDGFDGTEIIWIGLCSKCSLAGLNQIVICPARVLRATTIQLERARDIVQLLCSGRDDFNTADRGTGTAVQNAHNFAKNFRIAFVLYGAVVLCVRVQK